MEIFRPNAAAVAAKVIDGEAIIMNLTNGAYYSMDGVGATAWEMIEQGCTLEEIERGIAGSYAVDASRAGTDLGRLVKELMGEGLILAEDGRVQALDVKAPTRSDRLAYQPPSLNKHTEMADLLALDPPMPALGELPNASERLE